jgi:hypothetical protein
VSKLIEHLDELIEPKPTRVIFCCSEWQNNYDKLKAAHDFIEFHEGVVDVTATQSDEKSLVILDDLVDSINGDTVELFTKHSHHRAISVIFITQNMFQQNKYNRTMSLNTNYMVLFKNPRDITQVDVLGPQMYGKKAKAFAKAYKMATDIPHGYLLIDLKQQTSDQLRLRSNIFPGNDTDVFVI